LGKEKWKCPDLRCKQECGRRSNMVRHIDRLHGGLGNPVKEKPSATGSSIRNIHVKSDIPPSLPWKLRPKAFQAKEDFVDIYYKFSKIEEMNAFFGQRGSTIFPFPSPLLNSAIDPPVGYYSYTCEKCLTAPIDPVRASDFLMKGPLAFGSNHVCRQEDLETQKRRRENGVIVDFIRVWNELNSSAIKFMAKIVNQWYGPDKDLSIHVVEVDESISQHWNFLPTNLGKVADGHWAYRALGADKRKGITVIDERELMEFLKLQKSTFANFRVRLGDKEKNLYAYVGPELDNLGNWLPAVSSSL
jgi:hypothetical protein